METIDKLIEMALIEIDNYIPIDKETKNEYDLLIGVEPVKEIIKKYIRLAYANHI